MAQQISAESALPHFRQRCSELQDETLLLRARNADLEQEKTALEQRAAELEQQLAVARRDAEQPQAAPSPGPTPRPLSSVESDARP
jgi:cell division septum initiation protein DivIVA